MQLQPHYITQHYTTPIALHYATTTPTTATTTSTTLHYTTLHCTNYTPLNYNYSYTT